ncbi:hypothetical protein [Microcoleus asticus]|uniref:hypothetical protein n=1 Tax=Microcoleus asticus TaxID=2815231 RepID=UPI001554F317|nr:hypothetical protein [Microcoleus asticus]
MVKLPDRAIDPNHRQQGKRGHGNAVSLPKKERLNCLTITKKGHSNAVSLPVSCRNTALPCPHPYRRYPD